MFCWNCGNELSEGANFCPECGAPAADMTTQSGGHTQDTGPHTRQSDPLPAEINAENAVADTQDDIPGADVPQETTGMINTGIFHKITDGSKTDVSQVHPVCDDGKDLVLRKDRIILSEEKLYLKRQYYQKKGRKFKRKKGDINIPLSFISESSILHNRCGGKRAASFLLAVIFVYGTLTAAHMGLKSYTSMKNPYCQEQMSQVEDTLARLDDRAEELQNLDLRLGDIHEKSALLQTLLIEYQEGQRQELMTQAAKTLNLKQLFSNAFFEAAFEQYLTDLLDAFKNDRNLDRWLYPYYTYTIDNDENRYISRQKNIDMWFYKMPGSTEKFTSDIKDGASFMHNVSELSLYDLIYYYGRIYLSCSDLMNLILMMPDYVADGAVFVKAYGGNPDPANMSVPGWSPSDHADFWRNAERYLSREDPVWTYYNLSALDFDLDWNELSDEQAYYSAYVKFMGIIAPGLSIYDMVSYYGSDDAYGGMGFDITGKEAAPTEIALLYLKDHPEEIEVLASGIPTSYDDRIADTQDQVEQLHLQEEELSAEREALSESIAQRDSLHADYEALLDEIEQHKAELGKNLQLYCCITGFLFLMTIVSLCLFIRYLREPGHLMVLKLLDGAVIAFSLVFCSENKLAELQNRFPRQPSQPTAGD